MQLFIFEGGYENESLKVEPLDLQKADISGSKWQEVRAEELDIDNVSLAKTKINNVNMSEMTLHDVNMCEIKISNANYSHAIIDHVHLFGTEFHNVVLPMEGDGNYNSDGQYKPVSFHNCNLSNGQLRNCDLSNVDITDCDITGLKINCILISDLIKDK
jgi:uncharacterized protein YjbI with pentapeptide repeats